MISFTLSRIIDAASSGGVGDAGVLRSPRALAVYLLAVLLLLISRVSSGGDVCFSRVSSAYV